MGIMVMDSVPPATMTSAPPLPDALGRHGNRLQAGRAEAVDGHRRDFDRQSGAQGGDAGDVHALLGLGHGAAEDDVFDFFGVKLGHALERALDGDGGQIVGTGGAQRAFEGASDRGTNGGDDYDFTHRDPQLAIKLVIGLAANILVFPGAHGSSLRQHAIHGLLGARKIGSQLFGLL